jgi:class 3 adenylate cyclase
VTAAATTHLRRADAVLLALLVAGFAVCFALHVGRARRAGLAWVPVYTTTGSGKAGFPVVSGFWSPEIAADSGLAIGDDLVAVGTTSLLGAGRLALLTRIYRHADARQRVILGVRSAGTLRTVQLQLLTVPLAWHTTLFALAFPLLGALAFWRTRGFGPTRLFFFCALAYGLHWAYFWGGRPQQTLAGIAAFTLGPTLALPLAIRLALSFPPECASRSQLARIAPWAFGLAGLGGATWAFGLPFPWRWGLPLALGGTLAWGCVLLALLTRNFRRAGPTGQRQIKWVLIGVYLGLVPPLLASGVVLLDRDLWWLYELSLVCILCIPLGLLVAFSRDHLFDVDRLISAAATYTILSVLLITGLLIAVPWLTKATAGVVDARWSQAGLSLAIAVAVVGVRSRLAPWIDRLLFRERAALESGALALRQDLARCATPTELLETLGDRLDTLLAPLCITLYTVDRDELIPVLVRGPAAAPTLQCGGSLAAQLAHAAAPLRVPARRHARLWRALSVEETRALEAMGLAVLAPLRTPEGLAGFVGLGEKRSGDVYTETDLALLGSIADKASDELSRFRERERHEAEREMGARLRRYVPGALAEHLERGGELQPSERDVTVLFVDIRGYTRLAESRAPQAIFRAISAYTQLVSSVVREAGGTVVEFNGDGMMAVFGAPESHPHKERAAVDAARRIHERVRALTFDADGNGSAPAAIDVGIGVASGPAYVGPIQAADRAIWSALGNTTNLAARLQALTRGRDASIAIDEATFSGAGAAARDHFASIGMVSVRGRSVPVEVFTSRGLEEA